MACWITASSTWPIPRSPPLRIFRALIREDAAKKKPGEWIKLNGYDHNKLAEKRHPTKEELDEAAPSNPVQLTRCCAHMAFTTPWR